MQLAVCALARMRLRLQVEKSSVPLTTGAMRKPEVGVFGQLPCESPSWSAPKLWPISCAATSESSQVLRDSVRPTAFWLSHSESRYAMPIVRAVEVAIGEQVRQALRAQLGDAACAGRRARAAACSATVAADS